MSPSSFLLVLAGVLLNAVAQLMLKMGTNRTGTISFRADTLWPTLMRIAAEWPFWVGFTCYGVSVLVWIVALSRVPVSVAYPMLSIGYIVNALGARFLLGEAMGANTLAGIAFICVGVWLLARS